MGLNDVCGLSTTLSTTLGSHMRPLILLSFFMAFAGTSGLVAQQAGLPPGMEEARVDGVVAVVGDSAIFYSEIQEHLLRLQASGTPLPQSPQEIQQLERDVLDDLVAQTLILQAAQSDTLVSVSDERVEMTLQDAWADQVQRFGSEDGLREALEGAGLTVPQYRTEMREDIRKSLLLQNYVQRERQQGRGVPVEEAEIREFYERERARLGTRPATLTLEQVVLLPQPSDSARTAAREEAERILELLREGEDFADLARRFSDDPGSAQQGGELGWIRRGTMVQEFEDVAFQLPRGQTSGVVETSFGAHIIRVERIRGPERLVHHILAGAQPTSVDAERTRERAREIRDAVEGGTPITDFSDEGEQTGIPDSLTLAQDELDQLPSGYAQALRTAQLGAVVGPIEFDTPQGMPGFAVVQVRDIRDEGEFTYEDLRPQIRRILEDERFEERLVERLKSRIYVDVRL